MKSIITINNLSHAYHTFSLLGKPTKIPVLNNISLEIKPNTSIGLLGKSGCGKSSLARLIMGLETIQTGEIFFADKAINKLPKKELLQFYRTVQIVFQDALSATNPKKKIEFVLSEPLKNLTKLNKNEIKIRIKEVLEQVKLDDSVINHYPTQLSGGQLQRVLLARALSIQPKLLILDETLSNLDVKNQIDIIHLLKELQQSQSISMLFISHDIRLVKKLCSRIFIFNEGKIIESNQESKNPYSQKFEQSISSLFCKS